MVKHRRGIPTIQCINCGTIYEEAVDTFSGVYNWPEYHDGIRLGSRCPKCGEQNERVLGDHLTELYKRVFYIEDTLKKNKLM